MTDTPLLDLEAIEERNPATGPTDLPVVIAECRRLRALRPEDEQTAIERHLMDVYEALGLVWGEEPFTLIKRLRGKP